jgi:DNA-binding transcriptional ArsR family regulator
VAHDRATRHRAVDLRREGLSYREIRQVLDVSQSTLSVWLRDVPLTDEHRSAMERRSRGVSATRAEANRALGTRRRTATRAAATAEVGSLTENELFVAGIVAYWAEGAKVKPWRNGERVQFTNSDAGLVCLFLGWLQMIGVTSDRLTFRVQIHESADVERAVRYWSEVVGIPESAVAITLKRHNVRTVRKNTGHLYHGCLCVTVRQSSELNLRIAGWCDGLATQAARFLVAGSLVDKSGVV